MKKGLMSDLQYKRILLKLSGEALMGQRDYGIDQDTVARIASEIETVRELGAEVSWSSASAKS